MNKFEVSGNDTVPKIALVFHCYYVDVAKYVMSRIEIIPFMFDLYITTTSDQVALLLEKYIRHVPQIYSCEISIAPNRGRNFGPFLNEFGANLIHYDLMCHIHTKKSEHTDNFSHWGRYLIDNLIGNSLIIEQVLGLFEDDSRCGLVYPIRYSGIPNWAQSWLGNFHIAEGWCRTKHIPITPGFVEFPTGGMFWARPKAIHQLLNHRWTYNDFPEERGQIDGTMHHAVERLIGAITSHNGFHIIGIDPSCNIGHRLNQS